MLDAVDVKRVAYRPSLGLFLLTVLAFVPAFAAVVECGEERFMSGAYVMPTYREALAQCREGEAAMTHPVRGKYTSERSCYDMAPSESQDAWRVGRIGVDVVARDSGEPVTFEALWMCKPLADEAAADDALR